jgi:hypothetical protein
MVETTPYFHNNEFKTRKKSAVTSAELSSSPPPSSPSTDQNDNLNTDETPPSSSPERSRMEGMEEQPVVISPDFLPLVTQMVESLGPRRVKVYELRGEVWVDLGTGFCQGYIENVHLCLWGVAYCRAWPI